MELTVLGTDGAFPRAGGTCSGYLVRHDGFSLVVDLGTGALANLQRHVGYDRVDAVVLSHEHPDHCVDVFPLYVARYFHPEALDPLPLWAPPGAFERVARLAGTETEDAFRDAFRVSEVEPGSGFEVGPFTISTRPMPHLVPDLGMRIEADGAALAYTGDTGPSEEIEVIARDADVLLCEAALLDRPDPPWFHLSARQAGAHAARAGVRRLVLTHFWPGLDRGLSREQASEEFDGDLLLAEEGMTLEVGG